MDILTIFERTKNHRAHVKKCILACNRDAGKFGCPTEKGGKYELGGTDKSCSQYDASDQSDALIGTFDSRRGALVNDDDESDASDFSDSDM